LSIYDFRFAISDSEADKRSLEIKNQNQKS